MEWDEETCIKLIGKYRNREVLWNPRNVSYYNKSRKEDAWREVSEKIGRDINDVKKKMESLKGSYRREKTRMKKSVGTGRGRNKIYTSKWFGFRYLNFLDDKNEIRKTSGNVQTLSDEKEESGSETYDEKLREKEEIGQNQTVKKVVDEEIPDEQISDKVDNKEFKSSKKRRMKRKRNDEDPRIAKAFRYLKEGTIAAKQNKDQCSLFGEYIAHKLRTFDARACAIAQHRINNVLFELEMSAYQHPETPLIQSSHPIHSSQRNVYQSIASYNQNETQFGYGDQFHRTPISTSCSQPPSHSSNFQQQMLRPPTSQTVVDNSSRSSTPISQLTSPYPSPQQNESPA